MLFVIFNLLTYSFYYVQFLWHLKESCPCREIASTIFFKFAFMSFQFHGNKYYYWFVIKMRDVEEMREKEWTVIKCWNIER